MRPLHFLVISYISKLYLRIIHPFEEEVDAVEEPESE